jgi:membrane-associated protease RseP (regulator of RpoE activity)
MLSDTDDTATAAAMETPGATETPVQTPQPPDVPQTPEPAAVPPTANSQSTAGWFSRSWRYGVAAAVIVVVAGAFFTIGWFTSTHDDHGYAMRAREISQQMDLRERGFLQGRTGRQAPDQWQGQRNPEGQSQPNGQSTPETPSTSQAPSSEQGYLGVGVATVTPAIQQQYGLSGATGALVSSIDRTGPAFQTGVRRGDVITSIDGTSVATADDVVNLVAKKNAGDSVSVVIDRNGQSMTFQVTLAARPAAAISG